MVRIEKYSGESDPLHAHARFIRRSVFVEEQGVDEELEYEMDEEAIHYILFLEDVPVATARRRDAGKGIKLERFAMLSQHRNKGLGSVLLKFVLDDLRGNSGPVYLHSQLKAVSYYRRAGFVEEGPHFDEADIEHVKMVLRPYTKE
jgi:predicted GNAT family N-acyltransferase